MSINKQTMDTHNCFHEIWIYWETNSRKVLCAVYRIGKESENGRRPSAVGILQGTCR